LVKKFQDIEEIALLGKRKNPHFYVCRPLVRRMDFVNEKGHLK
jgi:hypothetical protein